MKILLSHSQKLAQQHFIGYGSPTDKFESFSISSDGEKFIELKTAEILKKVGLRDFSKSIASDIITIINHPERNNSDDRVRNLLGASGLSQTEKGQIVVKTIKNFVYDFIENNQECVLMREEDERTKQEIIDSINASEVDFLYKKT